MALLDFFKKPKKEKKKVNKKKSAVKARPVKLVEKKESVKTEVVKKEEIPLAGKLHPVKSREAGISPEAKLFNRAGKAGSVKVAPQILRSAQITEKAAGLKDVNQYVFRVFENANKKEVKKSVEEVYHVNVLKVRIVSIPKKKRRLGRTLGWRKGYKKAIVTIKKGQEIELIPR